MGRDPVRAVLGVDGFYIIMMQHNMFRHLQLTKGAEIQIQKARILHIAVDTENSYAAIIAERCSRVYDRDGFIICAVIHRRFCNRPQGRTASVTGSMQEGVIDRLCPATASVSRHNGGDHIHQLGKTGNLHPVGIAQERNQHGAHQKGIFEIIDILQKRECSVPLLALPDLLVLLP